MVPPGSRWPWRARKATACRIADSTNAARPDTAHSQPGISPANASITKAV